MAPVIFTRAVALDPLAEHVKLLADAIPTKGLEPPIMLLKPMHAMAPRANAPTEIAMVFPIVPDREATCRPPRRNINIGQYGPDRVRAPGGLLVPLPAISAILASCPAVGVITLSETPGH